MNKQITQKNFIKEVMQKNRIGGGRILCRLERPLPDDDAGI